MIISIKHDVSDNQANNGDIMINVNKAHNLM